VTPEAGWRQRLNAQRTSETEQAKTTRTERASIWLTVSTMQSTSAGF
jgi:hypothetical protein